MATYTIIGGDQKQYGLVTEDNIRNWIAEGRLNAQTLIKLDGDAEFRPLADYPEFADALAAGAAAQTAPESLPSEAAGPVKTSGLAIASLVLGILGVVTCSVTALIGLILGIVALTKIKKSQGTLGGNGLALAGIIVSAIFLLMLPVFAALLLPALAQAKQKAQTFNCLNNIKQLSIAMKMYAADNKDQYPAATNWCVALQSYAGSTSAFHCPADVSGSRCSYAFNARLAGAEDGKAEPNTVMIFEASGGWNLSGGPELLLAKPRHGRVVVVGFADGHVEQVPVARLSQLHWNP